MKLCDEAIQNHLISGGKIKRRIETYEIVIHIDKNGFFFDDDGDVYYFDNSDFIAGDWEVVGPEYDWDRIIKDKILCQFWDEQEYTDTPMVGYLTKKTAEGFHGNGWYCIWKHCKPFDSVYFNAAKNIKEYEK